jgi:S-adenosylmethionine-diacylglycerol 3-amino-3-carboxypropyl transferase
MAFVYNYGISQEDALTECKALQIDTGDSLLCIASAGEIPLNIAASTDVKIIAADTSVNQIRLCRIKQLAAVNTDAITAASFLGFMKMREGDRERIFRKEVIHGLSEDDRRFWNRNIDAVRQGVINSARFEKYIQKVTAAGQFLVGKQNLYRLFECNSLEEQKEIFDKKINGMLVRSIFRIAFHPWIYKNRGIDPVGLTHSGARNIGEFFFNRFRNFCCGTLSRTNYYLQYTFFNRILFSEALPEFLQPSLHERYVRNAVNIEYIANSLEEVLEAAEPGKFNKIHISNIGDWQSVDKMNALFRLIRDRTTPGARMVMRYIHLHHPVPATLPELEADYSLGRSLELSDRYPFYSVIPVFRK